MNIEIVEFYLWEIDDKKGILLGSLHVYLEDIKAHLRGVLVKKRKNSWYFGLPCKFEGKTNGTSKDKRARYPVFSYEDREKTLELRNLIIEMGKDYIMKRHFECKEKQ